MAVVALCLWGTGCEDKKASSAPSATTASASANVAGAGKLVSLDVATHHACAVKGSGEVLCWGSSQFMQRGRVPTGEPFISAKPAPVPGAPKAVDVVTSHTGTCARLADGSVSCWGMAPAPAPVGDGLFDGPRKREPEPIAGVSGVAQMDASTIFACAVQNDGRVTCWGDNDHGELGAGDRAAHEGVVKVVGLTDVVQVATGGAFACARTKAGVVSCWGDNEDGQLGDASGEASPKPKKLPGVTTAIDVDAHDDRACAALKDGSVRCWGALSDYLDAPKEGPQPIPGIEGATQVAVGNRHACAVTEKQVVWCWGRSDYGQRGNGRHSDVRPPSAVEGLREVTAVVAADDGTCAITDAGRAAHCWGRVNDGRLGNGWETENLPLAEVKGLPAFEQAAVGDTYSCGLTKGGDLHCWGDGSLQGCLDLPKLRGTPRKVASGLDGVLVGHKSSPFVLGKSLQMISGATCYDVEPPKDDPTLTAVTMKEAGKVTSVAGFYHQLALGEDGRIHYVALDGHQEEGGWTFHRIPVKGIQDGEELASYFGGLCVIRTGGKVSCFEEPGYVDTDEVEVIEPTIFELPGVEGATQLSIAQNHGCALVADGKVTCWNGNPGDEDLAMHARDDIGGKATLVAVGDAGKIEGCALLEDGAVSCWDDWATVTKMGQGYQQAPAKRLPVGEARWVGLSDRHGCVLLQTGKLTCWGDNFHDALGRPAAPWGLTPQKVQL